MIQEDFEEQEGCGFIPDQDLYRYADISFEIDRGNSVEGEIADLIARDYGNDMKSIDFKFMKHLGACFRCNEAHSGYLESRREMAAIASRSRNMKFASAKKRLDSLQRLFLIEHSDFDKASGLMGYVLDRPYGKAERQPFFDRHISSCDYCVDFLSAVEAVRQTKPI